MSLGTVQRAAAVTLVPGSIESISAQRAGSVTVIESGGSRYQVTLGAQAAGIPRAVTVPLRGFSAAIQGLLAACPGAAAEIGQGCGE